MKTLKWIVINGLFAVALWYGLHLKVEGAANVVLFYSWLVGIVGLAASSDTAVNGAADALVERGVPKPVDQIFDALVVVLLVWHGWWWTAAVFFIGAASMETARAKAAKLVAARENLEEATAIKRAGPGQPAPNPRGGSV